MSATWVRAQALGQPLTLTVMSVSRSGKRRSSSSIRSTARCLVLTMASLQNSMPVQAIVERRQREGSAERTGEDDGPTQVAFRFASEPQEVTPGDDDVRPGE